MRWMLSVDPEESKDRGRGQRRLRIEACPERGRSREPKGRSASQPGRGLHVRQSQGHSMRPFLKPAVLLGALTMLGVLTALLVLGRAAATPGDTVADRVFGQAG